MLKYSKILDFHIEDPRWRRIPHLCLRLDEAASATLAQLPRRMRLPSKITVALTKDAAIKKLNHDFRGLDKPTNVLSFPQFPPKVLAKLKSLKEPLHIGDIALSYQYVVGEAKKDNKILINHVIHLLIHGILHLFGYDHLSDGEAVRMEHLEKKIMAALGLPNPYQIVVTGTKLSPRIKTTTVTKKPVDRKKIASMSKRGR